MKRGDRVMLCSSGGGGFGRPTDRPSERVLEDVLDGFVSVEAARELYGVEIETSNGKIALKENDTEASRTEARPEGRAS